ncbi:MAG: Trk system potassium transporter TrkA [Archaeoglobales archaeon]|nr:Trk system potassium transporter TrkA [Archaeoglobales archaeon]
MRIVIAGAGEVGYSLATSLAGKHEIILIEKDDDKLKEASNLDVYTIKGNAANPKILKAAEVEKADLFLGVTGNDEVNLVAGIVAKKLGANKVVVRVENPEYVEEPIVKNHPLGYDVVICPQLALAQEIVKLAGMRGALEVHSLSNGKVEMVEVLVKEDSIVNNKEIKSLNLPPNVVIATIYRDGEIIIPSGDTVLKSGDRVAIVGRSGTLKELTGLFDFSETKKVTIFGAGAIGMHVAKMLSSLVKIKLIESNPEKCKYLAESIENVKVVCGDATDLNLLREEKIGESDIVIATTESDEKNLLISLLSKSMGAKKSIAKVEKGSYVKLFEAAGVDIALNPRTITYREVLKLIEGITSEVKELGNINVVEVVVKNPKVAKKKLKEIDIPKNVLIGAILRNDDCLIPRGDTEIQLNDVLLIFTNWENIEKVEEIFS